MTADDIMASHRICMDVLLQYMHCASLTLYTLMTTTVVVGQFQASANFEYFIFGELTDIFSRFYGIKQFFMILQVT